MRIIRSLHYALAAVLELIVALGPPVIITMLHQLIDVPCCLDLVHHSASWQDALLQILDQTLPLDEARQVSLTQEHHLH